MKYWVYKESRILGPFDKEGVTGIPGLDSGTLVCEGDPAGGSWLPAGEIKDLAGVPFRGVTAGFDDPPATIGLLDQLQIEAAGLVGDDDFPGSLAEDLFQDAGLRKSFTDAASSEPSSVEALRARERAADLTMELEKLHRRIAELELGNAELSRRLGEKDRESLSRETGAADPGAAKTFLSPAPPPIAAAPPPAGLEPPPAPADWAQTKGGTGQPLPALFDAPPPSKLVLPGFPGAPAGPAAPEPPPMPSFAPPALPADAAAPVVPAAPEPDAKPKTISFGKPKTFKTVPTVKSFKVLGAGDVAPAPENPAPTFSEPEAPPAPAAQIPPPPPPAAAPPPPEIKPIEPVQLAPVVPPPPMPAIAPIAAPDPVPNPFTLAPQQPAAPVPTPVAPPPNTLSSRNAPPVPDLGKTVSAAPEDLGSAPPTPAGGPPMTLARGAGAAEAPPEDAGAAARFAKPAPAPATAEPKPARSNKKFLIGGGILVVLLTIVGVIFIRQPKDDMKQMTTLDDGKPPIGLPAEEPAAPPIVKPRVAETPAPAPAPAPAPGPSAEQQAAVAAVKEFPLDGGRGTVGRWLEYSYTASPGAGTEEWNASATAEKTMLVEYRFVPAPGGSGKGALYLFEVDGIGLVIGKNLEARQMLAGGPPPEPPKAKKKSAPKKAAKRKPVVEEPKEVPLLPLPDSGELRPPAEDDGSFGSDTINQGI